MASRHPKNPPEKTERAALIQGVSCVILVGGESRRMGSNKARVELAGKALVERVLIKLKPLFREVFISTREEPFTLVGTTAVKDEFPGRGPAVGLLTTLARAANPWVFVIGCDHPLVRPELVRRLAAMREGYDCVVPKVGGRIQTLCALYKKSCIAALKERVLKGERGLFKFLKEAGGLSVRYVEEEELKDVDPGLESFVDVDTTEELERAEKILKKNGE
jgi:molybdopterin-guanine dinucleotide biosynthesis protein A